jgi:hypothetical protein
VTAPTSNTPTTRQGSARLAPAVRSALVGDPAALVCRLADALVRLAATLDATEHRRASKAVRVARSALTVAVGRDEARAVERTLRVDPAGLRALTAARPAARERLLAAHARAAAFAGAEGVTDTHELAEVVSACRLAARGELLGDLADSATNVTDIAKLAKAGADVGAIAARRLDGVRQRASERRRDVVVAWPAPALAQPPSCDAADVADDEHAVTPTFDPEAEPAVTHSVNTERTAHTAAPEPGAEAPDWRWDGRALRWVPASENRR